MKACATLRKRSYCSAISPNTQEHLSHQESLEAMVGKLCDFSKLTFPNACHRAFCYCTSCHFTFPSQTYIQKSFFYRKCSDNDQIYVLWNFGFYKDYMPKPWKSLSLSFCWLFPVYCGFICWFTYQVFIIGHVPPGAFERAPGKKWFYPQFNRHYIATVLKHVDVITGHFLAHQHCDSFKIFYDNEGKK